jgi:hypothetical protein
MSRKLLTVLSVLALICLVFPSQSVKTAGANAAAGPSGWTSGWVPLTLNNPVTLTHNLGGDPLQYATQYWFLDTDDGFGINTRAYGGIEDAGSYLGALWKKLTSTQVDVLRYGYDIYADQVRMWIWIPEQPPDWCSPWTAVAIGGSQVFTHNLGGNVEDYVVGMWFSGQSAYGVNQQYMGGMESNGLYYGAWWHHLTDSTLTVSRGANDSVASEVRVCVTVADPPNYDSGWVDVNAGELRTLSHNLFDQLDRYVVRMEFKDADPAGLGIHQQDVGGNVVGTDRLGAAWQNLTGRTIGVFRFEEDERTDQVRVRIWQRVSGTYLPLVVR